MYKEKRIIGRKENADFPLISLQNITVKIDTGAYTSSIHCEEITEKNGILYCIFQTHHNAEKDTLQSAFDQYKIRTVKSSNGETQNRYTILTKIKLGTNLYNIELTLTDRKQMRHAVLLGRKFLKTKFIVDPSLIYQLNSNI